MTAFIIRRLISGLVVLVIVSVLAFLLAKLLPGDPAISLAGPEATAEQVELIRQKLWLDRPIHEQYFHWIDNIVHGRLGMSVRCHEDVSAMIIRRAPITLFLAGVSFLIGAVVGTTAGVISAIRRGSLLDSGVTVLANFGLSIPGFWLGIVLIYVVGFKLGWLPIFGWVPPWEDFSLGIRKAIMPVAVLSFYPTAFLARQTRSSMLEVIHEDYIRTAWSKGLRERVVVIRHTLKNAFIPIITVMGVIVANMFAGSVLVETVFNIPGFGRLIVDGVIDNDFVVVQSCILVTAVVVLFVNLLVDLSYGWFDPRIRYR